jgi:signal transduction histidine kinase/ActR/RegA family two-component response regulator
VLVTPIRDEHGAVTRLLAISRDITEQKRADEERNQLLDRERQARADAEHATQMKDEFLATVSHELRTPLNSIIGWVGVLKQDQTRETLRKAIDVIDRNSRRQAQMIDELLDVARIVSGKLAVDRTPVHLSEVVRKATEIVQLAAQAKRIRIDIVADPLPGAIQGDGARLQQIILNLLSNAIKFTPDGGEVRVRVRRTGDAVEVSVTDNGPGIAADSLPSIFEPFRQADESTTRQHGGLGLGLAIVKHLVEAHGGTVTAENRPDGNGARFTVQLPMIPIADHQPGTIHAPALVDSTAGLEGLSVLLVEDDDESRHVIGTHLETRGAVVLSAASAPEALEILQREPVDVLLADVAMPGEDGYSLVRKVRASSDARVASLPAIALTALAREEDRHQALAAGFHLHLAKPIDGQSLVAAVASVGVPTAV